MFILINMAMGMDPPASPSASGASPSRPSWWKPPPPPLKSSQEKTTLFRREEFAGLSAQELSALVGEDRRPMSVTAYMHKSLKSKLALNKRSTLTKWAIDGATGKSIFGKTMCGKAAGGFFGGLASLLASPFTVLDAVCGHLKNETTCMAQEKITFYWKGGELWCRLPNKEVLGFQAQELSFLQDTKVAGIEGDFDNEKLVIRFEKTRGYQTASDRVIEMDKPYTNLKETLLWLRDNQGLRQEYLDESVLQYLEANDYGESRVQILDSDSSGMPGMTRSSPPRAGRPGLLNQNSFSTTWDNPGGMPGTTLPNRITPPDSPISSDSSECKMAEPISL